MKLYLNFKQVVFFIGVMGFVFSSDAVATEAKSLQMLKYKKAASDKAHKDYDECIKKKDKTKTKTKTKTSCTDLKNSTLQILGAHIPRDSTVVNQCEEERKKLNKDLANVKAACDIHRKNTAAKITTKSCAEIIKTCSDKAQDQYNTNSKSDEEKYKKEIANITEWEEKKENLPEGHEKRAHYEELIKNTQIFKECPVNALLYNKDYKKQLEGNKKEKEKHETKHNEIKEEIQELEDKIVKERETRDDAINKLSEGIVKNQRAFEKEQKGLEKDLQDKIAAKTKEVEQSQKLITDLNQLKQKFLDEAQKREFDREDQCHDSASKALREYRIARAQRIVNKTNRISFSTLVKRSKLSKKDRDKLYRQTMYKDCLDTPKEQKWLVRNQRTLQDKQVNIINQQKTAIKQIQQGQKDLEKIAADNHLEAGELLVRLNQDKGQLDEKMRLAQKNKERVIKNLYKQIASKKEQLRLKQLDLQEANLVKMKEIAALSKTSDTSSQLTIKSFSELEESISRLDQTKASASEGSCSNTRRKIANSYNNTAQ